MLFFFIILFSFLFLEGFILIEEETLIILASFFWVDAAGALIKQTLFDLLYNKGNEIQGIYRYFLGLQKDQINKLILLHSKRAGIVDSFVGTFKNFGFAYFIFKNINLFYNHLIAATSLYRKEDMVVGGKFLVKKSFSSKIRLILNKY